MPSKPNRIAAALQYLDNLRRQIASTQGMAVPDDYAQRYGLPGEPVPSMNQVGQSVRGAAERMTSLDAPDSQSAGDTALDIAAGFTPLQYPQAARDFERSRRTGDKLGMGLATLAAVPVVGGVNKITKKIIPDEYVESIIPPHEVRDTQKFQQLKTSMKQEGWNDRPILAFKIDNAKFALTGSHRIAAAKELGIDIPVFYVQDDVTQNFLNDAGESIYDLYLKGRDDEILDFLKKAKDLDAARLMKKEI